MKKYTLYCTEEQTRKALEFGAPIREVFYDVQSPEIAKQYNILIIDSKLYCIPTAEQVINWLEDKGISISIEYESTNLYSAYINGLFGYFQLGAGTRKEVTLAAIDAAFEDLMTIKLNKI